MGQVLDESGYHVVCLQEARLDLLPKLKDGARWSHAEAQQQFVCARQPSTVHAIMEGATKKTIAWAYFRVDLASPRAELSQLFILSLHLNHVRAKKKDAPAKILAEVPSTVLASYMSCLLSSSSHTCIARMQVSPGRSRGRRHPPPGRSRGCSLSTPVLSCLHDGVHIR